MSKDRSATGRQLRLVVDCSGSRETPGNYLGAAYPGSRMGMREGVILVEGSVGDETGLAMRRGLIAIAGAAGDGLGRAMIAGSIFSFDRVGRCVGAGMKRGTLAFYGLPDPTRPDLLPTFAASGRSRLPSSRSTRSA